MSVQIDEKKLYYFLAVKDILELFAEQELGARCEINVKSTMEYVSSFRFVNDSWGLSSKEDMYQLVTDDILDGYPIWQLLDIPEWTKNMLEKELTNEMARKRRELEKKYKCYTCEYFSESETALGILKRCDKPRDMTRGRFELKRRDFTVKKSCKYYKDKRKRGTKDDYSEAV